VVEAAAAEKFHIFPIDTIDEGIEILTGVPAGELDHLGRFPPGTINHMVAARLAAFGARAAEAAQRLLPGRRNHGRAKL
jgi:hypothetical protein